MRHIYVGASNKRTWCGEKPQRSSNGALVDPEAAPITEGEYVDGFGRDDLCSECIEAIKPVRGLPVEGTWE